MSFARPRLVLGLSPRILAKQRSKTLSSSIVAYRNIHSSCCSHASPLESSGRLGGPVKSPPLGAGSLTAKDEPGKDIDPYKDGQSAIDKAVHLFFFTEIIRGMCFEDNYSELLHDLLRNVDRYGEFLQATLHDHVPVRERPLVTSFPRRACAAAISQWRRTLHWFVNTSNRVVRN